MQGFRLAEREGALSKNAFNMAFLSASSWEHLGALGYLERVSKASLDAQADNPVR